MNDFQFRLVKIHGEFVWHRHADTVNYETYLKLSAFALTTRQLAEKVTEIYWPHTLPFGSVKTAGVLRQATGGQAEILSCIERFRSSLGDGSVPLIKARVSASKSYSRLLDQIEWKPIEMPLPRL
jgi:hypothetical protein